MKIDEVGLKSVELTIGKNSKILIPVSDAEKRIHDKYIEIKELRDKRDDNGNRVYNFINNTDVVISLNFEDIDGKKIVIPDFRGRYKDTKQLYSSLNSRTGGFWVPALLFSSNLKADSTGVPFASMPIGIAWGFKKYFKSGWYLGPSVMGNWLVYSEGELNDDLTSSTKFSVSSVSLGLLLDVNDAIYIGYSYGFDFREGATDPGHMLVIGFGSKAISFLKKKK